MKVISNTYYSNCLVSALKAKLARPKEVKLYFCPPRIKNGRFQFFHVMWSDGYYDYDFSDFEGEDENHPFFRYFWFEGATRQFKLGFAKRYSNYRKGKTATYYEEGD